MVSTAMTLLVRIFATQPFVTRSGADRVGFIFGCICSQVKGTVKLFQGYKSAFKSVSFFMAQS